MIEVQTLCTKWTATGQISSLESGERLTELVGHAEPALWSKGESGSVVSPCPIIAGV